MASGETASARRTASAPGPAPAAAGGPRRVGLLGAGYIADWHAKALATVAGVELVAVCDRALGRAQELAGRLGIRAAHPSLEAMLGAGRLDAVHVLLPPDLHFEAGRQLLGAGVHVLAEKPLCARSEECRSLVELAAGRGLALGVGHNFLFAEPYERLRRDLRAGVLGPPDHVAITWHCELPQARHGPFHSWMLREPGHALLEVGPHLVAMLLDLVGSPDELRAHASNPVVLPTGVTFHRRWQVEASRGATGVDLRISFAPGFTERTVHVRGALASATVDLDRNTYVLHRHRPCEEDLERHRMVVEEARDARRQARRTLAAYVGAKLHLVRRGSPYGAGIAGAMDAFYAGLGGALDPRVSGALGAEVVRVCEEIVRAALPVRPARPPREPAPATVPAPAPSGAAQPRILVLGATGFIGQELVRQLVSAGRPVRVLARDPGKLPPELRSPLVEPVRGDLEDEADLRRAMDGIACVYHLARASVKTWADYQRHEIEATARVAEAALAAGVGRFVYTGTIDSYYAGRRAGVITEATPLDPAIARRNLYARAKAASEALLARLHRERGLPLVIFRPGIVIGRGASPLHWGVGMWWPGAICQTWGEGRNKLPLVLVEDVARALVLAQDAEGLEGESFNLVADPCLSAQEYLDELERSGPIRIERRATPIARFYLRDLFRWAVKVLVRHPERRLPSYRDWESRTQQARFDCTRARERLGWAPVSDRAELIRRGIAEPLRDELR